MVNCSGSLSRYEDKSSRPVASEEPKQPPAKRQRVVPTRVVDLPLNCIQLIASNLPLRDQASLVRATIGEKAAPLIRESVFRDRFSFLANLDSDAIQPLATAVLRNGVPSDKVFQLPTLERLQRYDRERAGAQKAGKLHRVGTIDTRFNEFLKKTCAKIHKDLSYIDPEISVNDTFRKLRDPKRCERILDDISSYYSLDVVSSDTVK